MTSNQINYAKYLEEARHNEQDEALKHEASMVSANNAYLNYQAAIYQASKSAETSRYVAELNNETSRQNAILNAETSKYNADKSLEGTKYRSQTDSIISTDRRIQDAQIAQAQLDQAKAELEERTRHQKYQDVMSTANLVANVLFNSKVSDKVGSTISSMLYNGYPILFG